MATKRTKPEPTDPAWILAKSLKFIMPIQKKSGTVLQQFCNLSYNWACATNEIVTIGTPIEANLTACPHSVSFSKALLKCEGDLSIVQLNEANLSVTSGDFKAMVHCCDPKRVQIPAPDPCIAQVDDRVKAALAACATVPLEEHQNPALMAVLLQAGSAVATNGHMLLEYWHGIDLPPGLLIPKASAAIVGKADKEMTGFGFSQSSVTFWFKDGSFIKTQLFNAPYPDYQILFPQFQIETMKLHQFFFKGVKAIKDFAPEGIVYFSNGTLQTNVRRDEASTFKIDGLPNGLAFEARFLVTLSKFMDNVNFSVEMNRLTAFAENTRCIVSGVRLTEEQIKEYEAPNHEKPQLDITARKMLLPGELDEDDIPF